MHSLRLVAPLLALAFASLAHGAVQTVVLVHGAFADGSGWKAVADILQHDGVVLSSFPRAMLTMSAAFGLWRAGLISNGLFALGVAAVVLVLLGGTTWLSGGFWAPDGVYSRFVSPLICVMWVMVVTRVLLTRSPTTHAAW